MSTATRFPHGSEACLKQAQAVILEGGILIYPTDTLYGFGVDPRNNSALERLSRLKGRGGPWSIAVPDEAMLRQYGEVSHESWKFIESHLPGKVTFVLRAKQSDLSPYVLAKNNTVGMRIPHHPFPVKLTAELRFPITST
ncbi:MAG: Sua5/YciO/YrdC/YwlC family protein, partial [Candidatus Neomarinimicrobiota bacterium]